jgi:hypothetical protein
MVAHCDFKRRRSRSDKIKLADRTNKLAERRVLEDRVDQQCTGKVSNNEPRGPPRRRPKIEPLVQKQHRHKQSKRQPLVTQCTRPISHRSKELARKISHQHERTRKTKEVPGQQKDKHEGTAKVYPRVRRRKILRRELWTKKPVQNHRDADQK